MDDQGRRHSSRLMLNSVIETARTDTKVLSNKKPSENNLKPKNEPSPILYLSNYQYGGCTTFTAHLLHILRNIKSVICLTEAFDESIGDFGYGIKYEKKSIKFLDEVEKIFISDMYQNFYLLEKLKDKEVTIVIHDPGEIFTEHEKYLKNWKVLVIRKSVRAFLENKYKAKIHLSSFLSIQKACKSFLPRE